MDRSLGLLALLGVLGTLGCSADNPLFGSAAANGSTGGNDGLVRTTGGGKDGDGEVGDGDGEVGDGGRTSTVDDGHDGDGTVGDDTTAVVDSGGVSTSTSTTSADVGSESDSDPGSDETDSGDTGTVDGSCCQSQDGGCDAFPKVESCVCGVDAFCCEREWDNLCIASAVECGLVCLSESDCCSISEGPGCEDPVAEACVCDLDPECCANQWDPLCAQLAAAECEACFLGPPQDCCDTNPTGGCSDLSGGPGVMNCVCADNPECCGDAWNGDCVELALMGCGLVCA